jgi:7,8-dihydro-6-hydroxymethylpterin-pyrophosphokinase (HPPK)
MLRGWNPFRLRNIPQISFGMNNTVRCMGSGTAGERVFVAIGSNVGDRADQIRRAIERIRAIAAVVSTSFLYQSAP